MTKTTALTVRTGGTIVPAEQFARLPWWKKFDADDRDLIQHEVRELVKAKIANRVSAWVMGEHLLKLRELLEPQRVFIKTLRRLKLGFSQRTAYRYIDDYLEAARRLPEPVLRGAIQRSLDLTENMLKRLPPPPKNPEKVSEWLDQAERTRRMVRARKGGKISKESRGIQADPRVMQVEVYRYFCTRFRRLPRRGETRREWTIELLGFLLSECAGCSGATVTPVPIPDGFRAKPGRPLGSGKIKAPARTAS